jgi:hypothetical protein
MAEIPAAVQPIRTVVTVFINLLSILTVRIRIFGSRFHAKREAVGYCRLAMRPDANRSGPGLRAPEAGVTGDDRWPAPDRGGSPLSTVSHFRDKGVQENRRVPGAPGAPARARHSKHSPFRLPERARSAEASAAESGVQRACPLARAWASVRPSGNTKGGRNLSRDPPRGRGVVGLVQVPETFGQRPNVEIDFHVGLESPDSPHGPERFASLISAAGVPHATA